jgi:prepilin peptidase CpaA
MHLTIFIISVALLIAMGTDLHARRIPNWLVFPLLCGGIFIQYWQRGWTGCAAGLEGIFLIVLLYSIPFIAGGMGAGDIKLLAAIAAWIGPHQALIAFVVAGLAGGILALAWVILNGSFPQTVRNVLRLLCFWRRRKPQYVSDLTDSTRLQSHMMPYSPAIAIGTVVSFLLTH